MIKAIILASGKGSRFGEKKQFFKLNGKPLFEYSLEVIDNIENIDCIYLVLPEEDLDIKLPKTKKEVIKVSGGTERQFSVYNALQKIKDTEIITIHDAARPFAIKDYFVEGINNLKSGYDGSITAYKSRDTLKVVKENIVRQTLNREEIYIIQTPQTFDFDKLFYAHKKAIEDNILATDDSYLMERLGFKITINQGSPLNIKITTKEDITIAKCILTTQKNSLSQSI